MTRARIDIWHNIVWSRYKGAVFSSLYELSKDGPFSVAFFQMAETSSGRQALNGVDPSYHRYPYTLLFKGSLDQIGFFKSLGAILRHTIRSDADLFVLVGYEKPEVWGQMLIVKLKRKKVAIFCDSTIHDQPQTFWKGIAKKIIFRSVDAIFCYGQRSQEYVVHYGANPDTAFHPCQAAALPHDYTPQGALAQRLSLAKAGEPLRFLYVGRLSPEKNLGCLLAAFAALKKNYPAAELAFVGGGPQKEALRAEAKRLGLDPDAIFLGSKNGAELFQEYARATSFVLPSLSEPWGLVVNEALHYGCPVIVSDRCGCVPELVLEGKTGFSFDPLDVEALSQKMAEAVTFFSDVEKTAQECLDLMQNYRPEIAAKQILDGCRAVLNPSLARTA